MVLILEVTGPQAAQLGSASRKTFGIEGGIIGRDSRNAWVLPHSKVSGRHASISHEHGVFYIQDTSTNGVFVNGSKNRLGKGRTFALKSGDTVLIDPYLITVTVSQSDYADRSRRRQSPAPHQRHPAPQHDPFGLEDPFAEQDVQYGDRIVPSADDPHADPMVGHEVDPLKLIGGSQPKKPEARRTPPRAEDLERGSPLEGHYQPPRVFTPTPPPEAEHGRPANPFAIPDDYDPLAPSTKYRVDQSSPPPAKAPTSASRPAQPPARVRDDQAHFDLDDLAESLNPEAIRPDQDVAPLEPIAVPTPPSPKSRPVIVPAVVPPEEEAPPVVPTIPASGPELFIAAPPPLVGPAIADPPISRTIPPSPAERKPPSLVKPMAPASPAEPTPPAPSAEVGLTIDLARVLAGAGLDPEDVTPELARDFGRILRVVVGGVMEVLQARLNVKEEFRMRVTQFRPADNNPLKFSANVDDALHNLLVKRNAAYLKPVEAFDDAFDDLRHHQLAMLAGMRTAFETMLSEFHPDRLQEQFDRQIKRGGILSVGKQSRYWESYRDMHDELFKDPEVAFRQLFGDAFAKAYEEQLQRLKAQSSRPSSGDPPDSDN